MTQKDLLYHREDGVGFITINRENRGNAISPDAIQLFFEALDKARKDVAVKVVCITGAGDRVFCSGADLSGSMGSDADKEKQIFKQYADLLIRIYRFEKPTLARINGHCLAGGTGFMLACDIVLARDDATFGTPEVNVGLFPMMIGALIFRNVLRKKAMEMMMLGERLSAADALEMGMVTRIFPKNEFEEKTQAILKALTMKSPIGMKLGKLAFNRVDSLPFDEAVHFLSEQLSIVTKTDDAKEGISAFLEKRPPLFTGK
ncbi:MAG: enoyl-CoA hydratase/isomerase family protein [Proteobacteria bacterium]|nr:enoyl-CoA hydratase/isomerase family protein [Pseudomonadota bacterium]MBU1583586.1 enoyl-CoA hydratase/isomerase family protein [Pseudomonadota bacterium]MBU2453249.1 enoyl-CoA hydratase/isomerase family protein [Pseudomonadota bacterium]MBU2628668.1 enoyl-CoA hydratase/isomerase family protein [Pseudomonadota bacterium]